ncbi:hypothetical protein DGWBC_1394 [Dehalogenimonas sp. WBC-2]|nr:hypothetical protein DGWBC_1394 [Dehalogenimonas sp. WBC-2]
MYLVLFPMACIVSAVLFFMYFIIRQMGKVNKKLDVLIHVKQYSNPYSQSNHADGVYDDK